MPKKVIGGADQPFVVRVGWSDGSVQVGVETVEGHSLLTTLYGDVDTARAIGAFSVEPTKACSEFERGIDVLDFIESQEPDYRGIWSSLNRAQINDLIVTLRKARDKAYGADA